MQFTNALTWQADLAVLVWRSMHVRPAAVFVGGLPGLGCCAATAAGRNCMQALLSKDMSMSAMSARESWLQNSGQLLID